MNIGIVGSEAAKFTERTERAARQLIRKLLLEYTSKYGGQSKEHKMVSGGCHLGGIDIFAAEEARKDPFAPVWDVVEHLPQHQSWEFYRRRNEQIVWDSANVHCITVEALPPNYVAKGFERYCYHCKTDAHIKSGGCWTVKFARSIGKVGHVWVVAPDGAVSQFS